MSYNKLKKKQLINIIVEKENKIECLIDEINKLMLEKELLVKQPKKEKIQIIYDDEDKKIIDFLENQIQNTIYKDMKNIYKEQLLRIQNKYH